MPTKYKDIADVPEDERITKIAEYAMAHPGKKIAFITDSVPGKADRYIEKLTTRFPKVKVISRVKGPIPEAVTVTVKVDYEQ